MSIVSICLLCDFSIVATCSSMQTACFAFCLCFIGFVFLLFVVVLSGEPKQNQGRGFSVNVKNAKTSFLQCIGYLSSLKSILSTTSCQFKLMHYYETFKLVTYCLTAVKTHLIRYFEKVDERSGKKFFGLITNSDEEISKIK